MENARISKRGVFVPSLSTHPSVLVFHHFTPLPTDITTRFSTFSNLSTNSIVSTSEVTLRLEFQITSQIIVFIANLGSISKFLNHLSEENSTSVPGGGMQKNVRREVRYESY